MAFQIETEQLQEKILDFLKNELGDTWKNLPEEQRELIARVAINYGKENVRLVVAEIFQGIDVAQTKANIAQIKTQLLVLGVALQIKVIEALNKAIMKALQTLLAQMVAGNTSSEK